MGDTDKPASLDDVRIPISSLLDKVKSKRVNARILKADLDQDGTISTSELVQLVNAEVAADSSAKTRLYWLIAILVLLVASLAANAGLTYAIVDKSKDTEVSNGMLIVKGGDDNQVVKTGRALYDQDLMGMLMQLTPETSMELRVVTLPLGDGSTVAFEVAMVKLHSLGSLVAVSSSDGFTVLADGESNTLEVFETRADSDLVAASILSGEALPSNSTAISNNRRRLLSATTGNAYSFSSITPAAAGFQLEVKAGDFSGSKSSLFLMNDITTAPDGTTTTSANYNYSPTPSSVAIWNVATPPQGAKISKTAYARDLGTSMFSQADVISKTTSAGTSVVEVFFKFAGCYEEPDAKTFSLQGGNETLAETGYISVAWNDYYQGTLQTEIRQVPGTNQYARFFTGVNNIPFPKPFKRMRVVNWCNKNLNVDTNMELEFVTANAYSPSSSPPAGFKLEAKTGDFSSKGTSLFSMYNKTTTPDGKATESAMYYYSSTKSSIAIWNVATPPQGTRISKTAQAMSLSIYSETAVINRTTSAGKSVIEVEFLLQGCIVPFFEETGQAAFKLQGGNETLADTGYTSAVWYNDYRGTLQTEIRQVPDTNQYARLFTGVNNSPFPKPFKRMRVVSLCDDSLDINMELDFVVA